MKTRITTLLLACGTVVASPLPSHAQDARPPGPETIRPAQPPPPKPDGEKKPDGDRKADADRRPDGHRDQGGDRHRKDDGPRGRHDGDGGSARPGGRDGGEHRERPKAPEGKPVTYLGLLARALSPELAAQANLPEGFGLLVADVMKDSPAKTAGFEKYDVLVLIGDQRIVNLQQFQALIRSQKKGDEATLTVRRKGAEVKVTAKLGEHVMPAEGPPHGHPMTGHGHRGGGHPAFGHGPSRLPEARERFDEMRKRMEHFREGMRERFEHGRDGGGGHERAEHPGPVPPRAGFGHGPMGPAGGRGDHHQGPPPFMRRDGDGNRDHARGPEHGPGPRAEGPHGNGPRADGPPQGGPRPNMNGPRPEGDGPRGAGHPPAPAMQHRDGDRGPAHHAEGPQGNGPRADGPPQGGPRPNGPRPEGGSRHDDNRPGQHHDEGHREGARPDAPPPGGAPPPRA